MALIQRNLQAALKVQQPLVGALDGINRTYTTVAKFLPASIAVYMNGHRLRQTTPTPGQAAFYCQESGGPGAGYDTVVLTSQSPPGWTVLWADYIAAT